MGNSDVKVGCCLVILNPLGDKVLVARRKKEPDLGGFQIPGGTVDYEKGELPHQANVREAEEETGLVIKNVRFLCLMNSFYYGTDRPIHVAFVGRAASEVIPLNPEPHKAESWQWVPLNDLPKDKWFRMSKVAIDFYIHSQQDPTLSPYFLDREFASLN